MIARMKSVSDQHSHGPWLRRRRANHSVQDHTGRRNVPEAPPNPDSDNFFAAILSKVDSRLVTAGRVRNTPTYASVAGKRGTGEEIARAVAVETNKPPIQTKMAALAGREGNTIIRMIELIPSVNTYDANNYRMRLVLGDCVYFVQGLRDYTEGVFCSG